MKLGEYKDLFEAEYGLTEKSKGSDVVKFERILKLLNDRKLLYQKIPFQIDTDDLDPDLISDMIISEYKK